MVFRGRDSAPAAALSVSVFLKPPALPEDIYFLGSDRQSSALIVAKAQPLASRLFAKDTVFFLKIIEGILLPLVRPASKRNQ
jgi:hypothetical protein